MSAVRAGRASDAAVGVTSGPSTPPIVEARDMCAAYDGPGGHAARSGHLALRGVDLRLAPGELVALVGPNGAGKSTLLRCLTGLLRPSRGRALLDGIPVEELTRSDIARRVAVVPQQVNLPFAMRVEEVVALGRIPHEDPLTGLRAVDRIAVLRAMDRVGLAPFAARDARQLSLGERQLVLLATALAQEAPLLLLDEPTVHLDLRHQVATMELLRGLGEREGTAVLAVLHDLHLAAHFFPRVIVLDEGRVAADGPPGEVLSGELVRRVFGVDPDLVRWHLAG